VKAGTSPRIDGLRAEVELKTRQQQLIQAKNDYAIQKLTLGRVIGLNPAQQFELTDKSPYTPFAAMSVDDAIQKAEASRSDLKSAELSLRAAQYSKKAARAGYLPSINFSGDYGIAGVYSTLGTHGVFDVRGTLTIPIFQGNRVHADILQADATLANNKAQLENLRGQIDQDVRDALFDLQSSLDQVKVAKSNVDLASQTLDQARDRFVAGVTDNIEVVQAQEAVATANESEISSLFNYNNARILLARAQGIAETGVLQYLKGRSNGSTNGN